MAYEEQRYTFITGQIAYLNDKIIEAFSQFVAVLSAIAGGVVWLRTQPSWDVTWPSLRALVVGLTILVGLTAVVRISVNARAWFGFRVAEHELTNRLVSRPSFPRSCWQELWFAAVIIIATAAASVFFCLLK